MQSIHGKSKKSTTKALPTVGMMATTALPLILLLHWFGSMTTPQIRRRATITIGTFLPILSFGMSLCGGGLLHLALESVDGMWGPEGLAYTLLGGALIVLECCVLGVSLPHLSGAIGDLTKSKWYNSVLLAVTADVTLVVGELVHTFCPRIGWGISIMITLLMVGVALGSAGLNCWAFLNEGKYQHQAKRKSRKAKPKAKSIDQ